MSTAVLKEMFSGLFFSQFCFKAYSSDSLRLGISTPFSRGVLSPRGVRLGHDIEECHMRGRIEVLNACLILENVFCWCSDLDIF